MNMTDEILNSWTDADEVLADKIGKVGEQWSQTEIQGRDVEDGFSVAKAIMLVNKTINKVIIDFKGTTSKSLSAGYYKIIAEVPTEYAPNGNVVITQPESAYTIELFKTSGNSMHSSSSKDLGFYVYSGTVPSSKEVHLHIEWTYTGMFTY